MHNENGSCRVKAGSVLLEYFGGLIGFEGDEGEFGDVEEAVGGDFQVWDDDEAHEAEGHEGLDVIADAQLLGGVIMELLQALGDFLTGQVAHEAGDRQRQGSDPEIPGQ